MSNQNNTAVSMPQDEFARLLESDGWTLASVYEIDVSYEEEDEGDYEEPTSAGWLDVVATHEATGVKVEFAVGFYFVVGDKDSADMSFGRAYPQDEPVVTKNGAPLMISIDGKAMSAGNYLNALTATEEDSFIDDLFDVSDVIEQAIESYR